MDNTKAETINWDFLKEYIPPMELAALEEHAEGEEKEHFIELLSEVEKQIKAMPSYGALCEKEAQDITIGMHYFGGATDFWIFELDVTIQSTQISPPKPAMGVWAAAD